MKYFGDMKQLDHNKETRVGIRVQKGTEKGCKLEMKAGLKQCLA
jgi:hypothetical protein